MKMYAIQGVNSLYFLLAENEKDARATIHDDESIRECSQSQAFSIRYGGQPLYQVRKGIDHISGLDYICQDIVDKREYLSTHPDIYAERKYF